MAVQLAVSTRNARADAVESDIGTDPILKIRTGPQPADCATADSGTVLATLNLPTDWMSASSSGAKSKSGTWEDLSIDNSGTAQHFRIYDSGGATCKMQGSVTATSGGGDMECSTVSFVAGGTVTVTSFGWTEANA